MNTAMKKKQWNFILIAPLFLIILWRGAGDLSSLKISELPEVPSSEFMQVMAAGDQALLSRLMMIWMQQHDTQSGKYVSYRKLDYDRLKAWLSELMKLDPESEYAMLLATRVYTRVGDSARHRLMLEFVYQQFLLRPEKNWRWLSEAVVQAKYRLKDLDLALKYATALSEAKADNIPQWAKDSRLHVLEERGEIDQLRLIIGGMLMSGAIKDPNELEYLDKYLKKLEKSTKKSAK